MYTKSKSSFFRQLHTVFSLFYVACFLFLVLARPATDYSANTHYYIFSVRNCESFWTWY